MNNFLILVPIVIYLLAMLYIAYKVSEIKNNAKSFTAEYFIGNRSLGGFVLAMTIVATYIGASSFIGGPGIAYKLGLGWVLLACIQVPTAFFTLGILGKKMSIISRKINAITVFDILKARYNSNFLNILSSIILVMFFIGAMVAQFIGGARLFETVTGLPYITGLIIFSTVVIIYTTFGGFRAVTITDAIQAVVMFLATLVLFIVILKNGHGMQNIMLKIKEIDPNLLRPDSGGNIAKPFIMSFWVLVGIAILGLPVTTVRCMAFKDSKAMHNAMIIGTFVVGFLLLGMHLVGFMGRYLEPSIDVSDKLIPTLALKNLNPILAGVFIGGPLAAIMSTVDSVLILISSALVKDIYINFISKGNDSENKLKKISLAISFSIGLITYLLSINQSSLIVWINLFAFSGQEVLFFVPMVIGIYWKRGTAYGAIASVISGFIVLIILSQFSISILGLHNIVPSLLIALISYILVSLCTKPLTHKEMEIFFK